MPELATTAHASGNTFGLERRIPNKNLSHSARPGIPGNIAAPRKKIEDMTNQLDPQRIGMLIKEFLAERFDVSADAVTDDSSMRDLGLDSMMMLEIMLEVEDRLGVKLKDLSLPANPTLRDVVALVARNLAQT